MKLLKRLVIGLTCALCAVGICMAVSGCSSDPDANLPESTYVFYVYLEDGTTPVEGVSFEICYNLSATSSTCHMYSATTDSNGRAEIDLSSLDSSKQYNENGFCVHFVTLAGETTPTGFPDGYTYPAGMQSITLNGTTNPYEHAFYLTEQITTLKLTKE